MSLTEVLAVVGAVTGTTGSILGFMSYRRDRGRPVVSAASGKAAAHDSFLMHLTLWNAGRQPVTITLVEILRSRLPGLGPGFRLARFSLIRRVVERTGRLKRIGAVIETHDDPLVLAPNERKTYVLRALERKGDEAPPRPGFTYVCVVEASDRVVPKRVPVERRVFSWEDFS